MPAPGRRSRRSAARARARANGAAVAVARVLPASQPSADERGVRPFSSATGIAISSRCAGSPGPARVEHGAQDERAQPASTAVASRCAAARGRARAGAAPRASSRAATAPSDSYGAAHAGSRSLKAGQTSCKSRSARVRNAPLRRTRGRSPTSARSARRSRARGPRRPLVEALAPAPQRLGVVAADLLDVVDHQPRRPVMPLASAPSDGIRAPGKT